MVLLFIALFPHLAYSQLSVSLSDFSLGPQVSTNGMGISGETHWKTKNSKVIPVAFSLQTLKHKRETKVQNPNFINPKPYVYGKVQSASVFRISVGKDKALGIKQARTSQLSIGFSGGPSIGLTKPYYVVYSDRDIPSDTHNEVVLQDETIMQKQDNIVSAVSWTYGLDEISPQIGLNLDLHITLNQYASFHSNRWKTGLQVDWFLSPLSVMINEETHWYTSIYTSYQFGSKN